MVAILFSSHIIVANCGDSRAVICRGKQPIPLSVDHKVKYKLEVIFYVFISIALILSINVCMLQPNREDEYARIEEAGGKVIQWNGYRVFGVLAMSRSIGRCFAVSVKILV